MLAYILMTCAWLIAVITACFTFWQWRKCQNRLDLVNIKLETCQHRCSVLAFECDKKDHIIRQLHNRLEFHRTTR